MAWNNREELFVLGDFVICVGEFKEKNQPSYYKQLGVYCKGSSSENYPVIIKRTSSALLHSLKLI